MEWKVSDYVFTLTGEILVEFIFSSFELYTVHMVMQLTWFSIIYVFLLDAIDILLAMHQ